MLTHIILNTQPSTQLCHSLSIPSPTARSLARVHRIIKATPVSVEGPRKSFTKRRSFSLESTTELRREDMTESSSSSSSTTTINQQRQSYEEGAKPTLTTLPCLPHRHCTYPDANECLSEKLLHIVPPLCEGT